MILHYFAYGSNLHPVRLKKRVPSATPIAPIELPGGTLHFNKAGNDGSSKCSISLTRDFNRSIWGVLYSLHYSEVHLLDKAEGVGFGYKKSLLMVTHQGVEIPAFTYLVQDSHVSESMVPYDWYHQLVLHGARYFGFPEDYISRIESIESLPDRHTERASENSLLLGELVTYSVNVPWKG
jgi:hypothetical protein